MNCTNHCLQSHFSLAKQGCGGSFLKRRRQSGNIITYFQSGEKRCCLQPLKGRLWFCSWLLLLLEVGIPSRADVGFPLLRTPGRHSKSPVPGVRCAFFDLISCTLPLFVCIWVMVTPPPSPPGTCWDLLGTFGILGLFKMEVVLHRAVMGTWANIL